MTPPDPAGKTADPIDQPAIDAAMRRAIDESWHGAGLTAPNPRVGAVILDAGGQVAGAGHHARAGGDHAEVAALREAGGRARGGTAVVTLEPCRHHGRTPPCTEALLDAGVSAVVFAVADPLHAGGGEELAARGVTVRRGVREAEAREANHEWLCAVGLQRVHVTYKAAVTVDGRVAAADGSSQWISNESSRRDSQLLRRRADTVMAGIGTVLQDDPRLTRRAPDGRELPDQPVRVVIDSAGRTPTGARVLDDTAGTVIATADEFGADESGHVDLRRLCTQLYADGHRGALLEGGPTLAAAFLRHGLIDRIVAYLSPTLLGAGSSVIGDIGIATLSAAPRWRLHDVHTFGNDVRLTYLPPNTSTKGNTQCSPE